MGGEADPVSWAMLLTYSPQCILGHHGGELFLEPGLNGNKLLVSLEELHLAKFRTLYA